MEKTYPTESGIIEEIRKYNLKADHYAARNSLTETDKGDVQNMINSLTNILRDNPGLSEETGTLCLRVLSKIFTKAGTLENIPNKRRGLPFRFALFSIKHGLVREK